MTAKEVVLSFWKAMESNNFSEAAAYLSQEFENYSPQSSEIIHGRDNFVAINSNYPAFGEWRFSVNSIVAEGNVVVTDVSISDGQMNFKAITFHTVEDGLISKQVEYWPDDYPAPQWRRQWVEIVSHR